MTHPLLLVFFAASQRNNPAAQKLLDHIPFHLHDVVMVCDPLEFRVT